VEGPWIAVVGYLDLILQFIYCVVCILDACGQEYWHNLLSNIHVLALELNGNTSILLRRPCERKKAKTWRKELTVNFLLSTSIVPMHAPRINAGLSHPLGVVPSGSDASRRLFDQLRPRNYSSP
jgi:hypothetical protein